MAKPASSFGQRNLASGHMDSFVHTYHGWTITADLNNPQGRPLVSPIANYVLASSFGQRCSVHLCISVVLWSALLDSMSKLLYLQAKIIMTESEEDL